MESFEHTIESWKKLERLKRCRVFIPFASPDGHTKFSIFNFSVRPSVDEKLLPKPGQIELRREIGSHCPSLEI